MPQETEFYESEVCANRKITVSRIIGAISCSLEARCCNSVKDCKNRNNSSTEPDRNLWYCNQIAVRIDL